jgi:SAM-dependent methyltransferase
MRTIANVDMARAWDGEEGERWTAQADRYEAAGRRHDGRLTGAGLVASGDAVLDVGCGTGRSTRDAARVAAPGPVLGVDLSSQMLEEARRRAAAEGLANVSFEQADVQVHPFADGAFDAAISSFGAMFFADPVAAFANIGRALRPGGRLAVLAWRDLGRNQWVTAIRDALALGRALPEPPAERPRGRSAWRVRTTCAPSWARRGSAPSSSSRWTSRCGWATTPTTRGASCGPWAS